MRERGTAATSVIVGVAFLGLACWFLFGPPQAPVPSFRPRHGAVPARLISTAPRRTVLGDPPTVRVNGFPRTCMDCHRLFPSGRRPDGRLQHTEIVLEHGPHDDCLACHDDRDRDRLRIPGGETVSYGEVVRLCSHCHPALERGWKRGTHGRTNGYWDPERGLRRRLICTECHDPHAPRQPAMAPIEPLPGPDTLRMGRRPGAPGEHGAGDATAEEVRDPLREAARRAIEHAPNGDGTGRRPHHTVSDGGGR